MLVLLFLDKEPPFLEKKELLQPAHLNLSMFSDYYLCWVGIQTHKTRTIDLQTWNRRLHFSDYYLYWVGIQTHKTRTLTYRPGTADFISVTLIFIGSESRPTKQEH